MTTRRTMTFAAVAVAAGALALLPFALDDFAASAIRFRLASTAGLSHG